MYVCFYRSGNFVRINRTRRKKPPLAQGTAKFNREAAPAICDLPPTGSSGRDQIRTNNRDLLQLNDDLRAQNSALEEALAWQTRELFAQRDYAQSLEVALAEQRAYAESLAHRLVAAESSVESAARVRESALRDLQALRDRLRRLHDYVEIRDAEALATLATAGSSHQPPARRAGPAAVSAEGDELSTAGGESVPDADVDFEEELEAPAAEGAAREAAAAAEAAAPAVTIESAEEDFDAAGESFRYSSRYAATSVRPRAPRAPRPARPGPRAPPSGEFDPALGAKQVREPFSSCEVVEPTTPDGAAAPGFDTRSPSAPAASPGGELLEPPAHLHGPCDPCETSERLADERGRALTNAARLLVEDQNEAAEMEREITELQAARPPPPRPRSLPRPCHSGAQAVAERDAALAAERERARAARRQLREWAPPAALAALGFDSDDASAASAETDELASRVAELEMHLIAARQENLALQARRRRACRPRAASLRAGGQARLGMAEVAASGALGDDFAGPSRARPRPPPPPPLSGAADELERAAHADAADRIADLVRCRPAVRPPPSLTRPSDIATAREAAALALAGTGRGGEEELARATSDTLALHRARDALAARLAGIGHAPRPSFAPRPARIRRGRQGRGGGWGGGEDEWGGEETLREALSRATRDLLSLHAQRDALAARMAPRRAASPEPPPAEAWAEAGAPLADEAQQTEGYEDLRAWLAVAEASVKDLSARLASEEDEARPPPRPPPPLT
eukprot:tig00001576_g9359.t1